MSSNASFTISRFAPLTILSRFSESIRSSLALRSVVGLAFACVLSLATCCGMLRAQDNQDAIQRIESEYNTGEKNRRLTAVTFRSLKKVSLSSDLIRLGDVVEPMDPELPGWSHLSKLGIGLVPVDGTEMVIERVRLEPFIHSGQENPILIRWIGPVGIRVCCRASQRKTTSQSLVMTNRSLNRVAAGNASASEILRASVISPDDSTTSHGLSQSRQSNPIAKVDSKFLSTVQRWIRNAFSSTDSGGLQQYDFRILEVEKIRPTKRDLDLAILGQGFLHVVDPASGTTICVPAGKLDVDVNGDLVVASERLSLPLHPVVNIPADTVNLLVKSDGVVKVQQSGTADWVTVGKLLVSTSGDPVEQASQAGAVSLASAAVLGMSGTAFGANESWQMLQGFLESSSDEAYHDFESITGVEAVTCLHALREGLCRFRIQGRGLKGPIDLVVSLELTAKPVVAAARKSFARGHRLGLQDLHLIAIEVDQVDEMQFNSLEQLVGMEVSKSLRVNRPIVRNDVRKPTLVRRGDLLDLRVVGAGIVVTTAAKALGDGPLDGLIEVETMRPRKRRIARVVAPGVVEILSRPPQVGNLLETRRK